MTSLETLCINLGIQEHIPALSEWRDNLIREKATELQEAHRAAEANAAVVAEATGQSIAAKNAEITGLQAEIARLKSLVNSETPV